MAMTDYPDAEERSVPEPKAVGWFGVRQLAGTGLHALVTAVIGTRSARREVLAALDRAEGDGAFDFSASDALWLDYVADLGDGFDATEAVAWLVGRDHVFIGGPGEKVAQPIPPDALSEAPADAVPGATALSAAGVLVFGGDETYPVASQENYRDRTVGPYHAARPWGAPRAIFAIPGNHDWYDGLGAFIRNFCQKGRWIGCWEAQQTRSYFALRLPHGFWLWGLDLATEDDIDPPQLAYFQAQAARMQDGDQLVLCVPAPAWLVRDARVRRDPDAPPPPSWEAWSKLGHILDLATKGPVSVTVPLLISGDLHHYCRYVAEGPEPRHYVTCGGGGAFTLGTAGTPEQLAFEDGTTAGRKAAFPSHEESMAMRNGVWKLVWRHKAFCATLSALMLGLVWVLNAASIALSTANQAARVVDAPLVAGLATHGVWGTLGDLAAVLLYSPAAVVATLAIAAGFIAFAGTGASLCTPRWGPPVAGLLHFAVQLAAAFALAALASPILDLTALPEALRALLMAVVAIAAGWFVHGILMAAYLYVSNLAIRAHELELYSSQAIEDWKSFLRLRVDARGLTVFPIGLARVPGWRPAPLRPGEAPPKLRKDMMRVPCGATHLFDPKDGIAPELIEAPIHIPVRGTRA
jgi:hypothetical protein